ncbi:hypothetical protein LOTGIDRAFT_228101 [Lottia gigantea]|uniref:Uncharacterized protein n=1 Tax=Lottia gigantea TaxID=225164 RepID=V4BCU7_LOTGI|nr:hypothetical protein LOTGIDRAFT_228101 [Lottia gigantea]ESP05571.1 hypothetical protein LOTGIDRAFT_228101 [Lottia gigantea]
MSLMYPSYERDRPFDRRFPPLQRYETVTCDGLSEPSSASFDGVPISPRRNVEFSRCFGEKSQDKISLTDEITETTKLTSDFEKSEIKDRKSDEHEKQSPVSGSGSDDGQGHNGARRVSFQLQNLSQHTTPTHVPHPLKKFRRYTEGDFHHLKRSKIAKVSVPRQYSLGAPIINGSVSTIEQCINHNEKHRNSVPTTTLSDVNNFSNVTVGSSPPKIKSIRTTQVSAEIHQYPAKLAEYRRDLLDFKREIRPMPPLNFNRSVFQKPPYSQSLETVSPTQCSRETRKVKSYEDVADYDVLKITEFSTGPFYNSDFEVISEHGSPFSSKVRYNDTGSLEKLNEEQIEYLGDLDLESVIPDESDDTETLNGTQKYRELWSLRTTLEEEEECSDTIRMENMTSPEESPDRDHATLYTTSFESNTEPPSDTGNTCDPTDSGFHWERSRKSANNLLHPPNQENRRQNYRNILSRRLQKAGPNTSTENSFDSIETDGDVSDTSRYEVTTSFESTTDNTDSTTESQHRLQQMKGDSGYKSLETQQSTKDSVDEEKKPSPTEIHNSPPKEEPDGSKSNGGKRNGNSSYFDRRNARTASKKRREYSRQTVRVYESINEPETDSRSDLPSGDSFEDNAQPSKMFVFSRFFKSHSRGSRDRYLQRDYSIDEKTNKIFNDFMRSEPVREPYSRLGVRRSPRLHNRHRLHRKQTEPLLGEERRRDRLAPERRSTSLGSDSSASSVRRLSPQDSIEEEEFEGEEEEGVVIRGNDIHYPRTIEPTQPTAIHPIPIIKLPEEESGDS